MPITYSVDTPRQLIFETWSDDIDIKNVISHWRVYLRDPIVMGIRRTLVDIRKSRITFTGWELAAAIDEVAIPILGGRDWKTAILVEHPVQRGIGNQYHYFADIYSSDQMFDDKEKAVEWLLQQALT